MSPELVLRLMCPSEALPQNGKPPYDLVSDFSDGSQAVGREGGHSPHTTLPRLGVWLPSAGLCIQRGTFSQVTKYSMLRRVAFKR